MSEPGSFWAWSVEVYGRPDVAAACQALQDRHGIDVNLLLLGLWLAVRGEAMTAEAARELAAYAAGWQQEVVRPLRGVRRRLKSGDDAPALAELRRNVAAVELAAERLEQDELARRVHGRTHRAAATRGTAEAAWCRLFGGMTLEAPAAAALLAAVFGGADGREAPR